MIVLARTLGAIPSWVWYVAVAVLLGPWVVRYSLAVIGQGCNWAMPPVGR